MTDRRVTSVAVLCELDNGKVHQLALNKYEEEEVRTLLICYIYNKYQKIKCHEEELPIVLKNVDWGVFSNQNPTGQFQN